MQPACCRQLTTYLGRGCLALNMAPAHKIVGGCRLHTRLSHTRYITYNIQHCISKLQLLSLHTPPLLSLHTLSCVHYTHHPCCHYTHCHAVTTHTTPAQCPHPTVNVSCSATNQSQEAVAAQSPIW